MYTSIQGDGPRLLVIIQPGAGNADAAPALVAELANDFRVLTYDRRGLSRSPVGDGPVTVETHTDDLALLLARIAKAPVDVLGLGIGALIGLDLAARYPGLVRTLIAHEPPLSQVLDDPSTFVAAQRAVEEGGVPAGMEGGDLEFFFTHDLPAARRFRLYLEPLLHSPPRVIPAAGHDPDTPAAALAEVLGTECAAFPGGHSGHVTHPREFAAVVRELLLDHHWA